MIAPRSGLPHNSQTQTGRDLARDDHRERCSCERASSLSSCTSSTGWLHSSLRGDDAHPRAVMPIQPSTSNDQFGFWDAAHQGDLRRLRQMIDGGCDVNGTCPAWKSAYQPTALAYAVWGNQLEAIKLLLEAGANPDQVDGVRAAAHFPTAKAISFLGPPVGPSSHFS